MRAVGRNGAVECKYYNRDKQIVACSGHPQARLKDSRNGKPYEGGGKQCDRQTQSFVGSGYGGKEIAEQDESDSGEDVEDTLAGDVGEEGHKHVRYYAGYSGKIVGIEAHESGPGIYIAYFFGRVDEVIVVVISVQRGEM